MKWVEGPRGVWRCDAQLVASGAEIKGESIQDGDLRFCGYIGIMHTNEVTGHGSFSRESVEDAVRQTILSLDPEADFAPLECKG